MPRQRNASAIKLSQASRKQPSVAEQIMWKALRNSHIGFKFRREHPIGPYRLDFFCPEAMLAVELDGEQHSQERDRARDLYFEEIGILTYRIKNLEFFNLEEAPYRSYLSEIKELCLSRTPTSAIRGEGPG